jgi:hypothetical protein
MNVSTCAVFVGAASDLRRTLENGRVMQHQRPTILRSAEVTHRGIAYYGTSDQDAIAGFVLN